MLVCFVLDVHPSMGKRSAPCGAHAAERQRGAGLSSLEWAKSAVEYFIKARQKANCKDQYFLVTTDEGLGCVRVGWGDSPQRFDDQLRLLAPLPADGSRGGTDLGRALQAAFGLLNQYRLQQGIDNYGQGRCPWLVEPGCCLLFTDGESMRPTATHDKAGGPQLQLACPPHDLTKDPYRWDQRVFSLCVQQQPPPPLPATATAGTDNDGAAAAAAPAAPSPLPPPLAIFKSLAESTGGYYSVSDGLMGLNASVDLVVHRLKSVGPVVLLSPDVSTEQPSAPAKQPQAGASSSSSTALQAPEPLPSPTVRAVLSLSQESAAFMWPIPEAFWVDRALEHLPKRDAQPTLLYRRLSPESQDPALTSLAVLEDQGLAMDRYPLEWCGSGPGGLKMGRDARWPVYLLDSGRTKGSRGDPFGYLEASELAGRVTLVLLPYNYPKLAELVRQAVERGSASGHLTSLPVKWRPEFNLFLTLTPPYYYPALRRCLKTKGLHSQVPENKAGGLGAVVVKRLQRLRDQALEENRRYESSRSEHPHYKADSQDGSQDVAGSIGMAAFLGGGGGHKQQDLLALWEGMRQRLFGERGHVTSGLYLKGFKSWRGACGGAKARREDWTLLGEVGALQVPENPIMEMGAYMETLLATEMLRDPLAEPDPREDNPEAMLARKLAVNFGNPFKLQQHHHPQLPQPEQPDATGAVRGMLSAEAENEAAVLGPHSVLGEDLDMPGNAKDDGLAGAREGAGEANDENGDDDEGNGGQPDRKRQRMSELPPLPIAKKLRRRPAHGTGEGAPPGAKIPMAAHPGSPPLTPMVANSPSALDLADDAQETDDGALGNLDELHLEAAAGGPHGGDAAQGSLGRKGPAKKEAPDDDDDGGGGDGRRHDDADAKKANAAKPKTAAATSTTSAAAATTSAPASAAAPAHPRRPIEELLKDKTLTTPSPEGWMLAWSKREKRAYYFNVKSNLAVWQAPPGLPAINEDT